MNAKELEIWCQENGWTEPRQLEIGIWVAFPPGGAIENIIPDLPKQIKIKSQLDWLEIISEYTILSISAVVVAAGVVFIAPYFVVAQFLNQSKNL